MMYFPGLQFHGNLMVTMKSIQKTHPQLSIRCIHQLINLRHRKEIFRACSVKVGEVHTHFPFIDFLSHDHYISQSFQKIDFFYRPHFSQPFYFLLNSLYMLFCRPLRPLLFQQVGRVHIKLVSHELWIHPGHLIWTPGKNIQTLHQQ